MRAARTPVIAFLLLASFLGPASAGEDETVIVSVVVNGETKGEFFVRLTGGGDFLVRAEDLKTMGFRDPAGELSYIDGEPYLSLGSIRGVTSFFDERILSLEITAPPSMLPKRTIDFTTARRAKILYPEDDGGFLNYGVTYSARDSLDFFALDVASTLGARVGDFLFLTDTSYRKTTAEDRFARLMSSITYDRRQELQRAVLGDFFASSGELGSSLNLGGLSFSKVFRIDPYFIRYPLADFTGLVSLPSEVEVYLDGTRIRTERLSPGEFELRNLSSYDGAGVVTVVIKDPFGGERRIVYPFYFTESLLKVGLHEYSYNVGFIRKEFGVESNRYGDAVFSAFHRYGLTDALTIGFGSEGGTDRVNLGPRATYRLGNAGILSASAAGSVRTGGRTGGAGLINHLYQDRRFSTRVFLRAFSRDYARAGEEEDAERVKFDAGAGVGYGTREFGSLSVDVNRSERYRGGDSKTGAVTYSRNLTRSARMFLSYRRIEADESSEEIFAGVTYYPGKDIAVSGSFRREQGLNTETVEVQKNPPVGEGLGFRGSIERKDASSGSLTAVNPFLQYNGRYGIYTGEYRGLFGGSGGTVESYRVSASGGVAYVGRTFGFSRPISDSFGLVRVDGLPGVRVYRNNQEVGRTDAEGEVFLPNLTSYYENLVSIEDRDIPIEYSLSEVSQYVSPPLRSGSVVRFDAKRFQAITGTIGVVSEGKVVPVEFSDVRIRVGGADVTFPTGRGGEFYLENIDPGAYEVSFTHMGKSCTFDMVIPATEEMIIDLGGLVCENAR